MVTRRPGEDSASGRRVTRGVSQADQAIYATRRATRPVRAVLRGGCDHANKYRSPCHPHRRSPGGDKHPLADEAERMAGGKGCINAEPVADVHRALRSGAESMATE